MQFHLNGFRPGDPEIFEPAQLGDDRRSSKHLPAEVDVLIIGCGPAGLTLAAQLAAFPDINTRIVDQKSGPLLLGQADGIACRTMEMFQAFGFAERVLKEAYWVSETTFWKPDDSERRNIVRSGRVQDVEDGLSELPHVTLNQTRVHDFYLQVMRNAPSRLEPDYARRLIDVRAIFQEGHRELAVEAMPSFLIPRKGRYGLRDYEKIFSPDLKSGNDIFDMRGIDRDGGCMVVVRPDQYVAHILPLDAFVELATFFDGFMIQED